MSDSGPSAAGIMAFLGGGAALVALLSAGIMAWQVMASYRLLRLPQAHGTMLSCAPVLSQTDDMATSGNTPRSASMWTVKARFTYMVDGKVLEGHSFSQRRIQKIRNRANPSDPPPESVARLCQPYPAGSAIQVYYHPDDPQDSFVYFNPPLTDWPWALIPVVAGLLAAVFFFLARLATKTG